MFSQILATIATYSLITLKTVSPSTPVHMLATHEYSLTDRYSNTFVNDVFADNILLTLNYLSGKVTQGSPIDWTKITAPFDYQFILKPGETFAFHNDVLPEYKGKIAVTTNAHFDSMEGFKSDGWLVADGVCHLASFINVVARDAGLTVVAPTSHDFATIPDVARKDGVAIYYMPGQEYSSSLQNLYVTNTKDTPIVFVFTHKENALRVSVVALP